MGALTNLTAIPTRVGSATRVKVRLIAERARQCYSEGTALNLYGKVVGMEVL